MLEGLPTAEFASPGRVGQPKADMESITVFYIAGVQGKALGFLGTMIDRGYDNTHCSSLGTVRSLFELKGRNVRVIDGPGRRKAACHELGMWPYRNS